MKIYRKIMARSAMKSMTFRKIFTLPAMNTKAKRVEKARLTDHHLKKIAGYSFLDWK
jgi:hypothetical protein